MTDHIDFLVNLTSLDECGFAGVQPPSRWQRLAAIQDIKTRDAEIQPSPNQFAQQRAHYRCVLRRALAQTQHRLAAVAADAQHYNHLTISEASPVDQYPPELQRAERAFHQF